MTTKLLTKHRKSDDSVTVPNDDVWTLFGELYILQKIQHVLVRLSLCTNRKAACVSNSFNCHIETEGRIKVTGSVKWRFLGNGAR